MRTFSLMHEVGRKLVHIVFGLGIAAFILVFPKNEVIILLAAALLAGFILSDALSRGYHIPGVSHIVDILERKDVLPGKGALYFTLSSLFCLIVFPTPVVAPAVITLAVLDGVATLVGMKGRIRIMNGKSVEGTVAGILVTIFPLLLFIPPLSAVLAAITAGVIELISPVDDNLIIPPGICLLLIFLPP